MANQWPSPIYTDGVFTTAQPCSLPQFTSPIAATTDEYVFTQDFIIARASFTATPLNTLHDSSGKTPDYSTYFLVNEGERRDIEGGLVRWTRTYAKKPASYSDFETYPYSFIGTNTLVGATVITRTQQTRIVSSRLLHEFYIVGTSGTGLITPDYASAGAIPIVNGMHYVFQATISGFTYGGITMETTLLQPAASSVPTYPTSEDYQSMVSDALSNGWSATVTVLSIYPTASGTYMAGVINTGSTTLGGQIPAENSRINRWNGNIWERVTRFILAE
jgi:hypothetical protein